MKVKTYMLGTELVVTNYREIVLGYISKVSPWCKTSGFYTCDGYRDSVGVFFTLDEAINALVENANV